MIENNLRIAGKLVLGTAQIGSKYGITNNKIISDYEIKQIFKLCKENNIIKIDTAASYRNSEKIIGKYVNKDWIVNTKLPSISNNIKDINSYIRKKINNSVKILNIKKINCLFIHNSEILFKKNSDIIYQTLFDLKKEKLINKIGISVYTPYELERALNYFEFDCVQIPISILNQKFMKYERIKKLKEKKIVIQARSIFLQGLLLADEENLPKKLSENIRIWKIWHQWINDNSLNKLQVCLSFILSIKEINEIIFGLGSFQNLVEIIHTDKIKIPYFPIELIDETSKMLDPRRW